MIKYLEVRIEPFVCDEKIPIFNVSVKTEDDIYHYQRVAHIFDDNIHRLFEIAEFEFKKHLLTTKENKK